MRIAILSDTHGRIAPTEFAVRILREREIEHVLHCGDIDDAELVASFPPGTHFVWGNCDDDRAGIGEAIERAGLTVHGAWGHLKWQGRNLAFTHGDDRRLLADLENADAFDFVFHGHTHVAREQRVGRTRVINPGALHRAAVKSFAILDLKTGELQTIVVEP